MILKLALAVGVASVAAVMMLNAQGGSAQQAINPADYSATITNRLLPLSLLGPKVIEGTDLDDETGKTIKTRLESTVLAEKTVVAGVTVTVLEEKAYKDGELVEVALDYFAQHKNGDVYYFGELVDNFENGKLKDHHGQWLAGENGNLPGVLMAAKPEVGKTYIQEIAPGIAEDQATVLSITETVVTNAGTFSGCMKTKDTTPLEPGLEEFKWYCPDVGMVAEEGDGSLSKLVSVGAAPAQAAAAATQSASTATPRTGVTAPNTGTGSGSEASPGSRSQVWMLVVSVMMLISGAGVALRGVNARSK